MMPAAMLLKKPPGVTAPVHILHPGDVVCVTRGERIEILLGSCVAVILTDPRRTVGAACHIVHAGPGQGGDAAYAGIALQRMHDFLTARGIAPQLCEAYVHGGGNMFPNMVPPCAPIGDVNAQWVLRALAREGVRVLCSDIGGDVYRRLSWTVGPDHPDVAAVPV
jgi:chemotaxis protein CheD